MRWYWVKDELVVFARALGVRTTGSKDLLTGRIAAALDGVTFEEPSSRRVTGSQLAGSSGPRLSSRRGSGAASTYGPGSRRTWAPVSLSTRRCGPSSPRQTGSAPSATPSRTTGPRAANGPGSDPSSSSTGSPGHGMRVIPGRPRRVARGVARLP
nr:SAP domain-containing protein [Tessaracoccus coleopterorum]